MDAHGGVSCNRADLYSKHQTLHLLMVEEIMIFRLLDFSREEMNYSFCCVQYIYINNGHHKQKVLVNGSPKTGTTWMLRLLDSIPGYSEIGNFYGDIQRYNEVQPGEIVHGHDWCTPTLVDLLTENQIKVVLLLRDPRDQLISRVFHIRRDVNHNWHDRLRNMPLDQAISVCIEGGEDLPSMRTMIELTQSWLNNGKDFSPVRYEDLVNGTQSEFQRVLRHLDIQIPAKLSQMIVSRNKFERLASGKKFWQTSRKPGQIDPNSHFRKGIVGDWRNYYNDEHKDLFKEVAGDKLVELGYETNFCW